MAIGPHKPFEKESDFRSVKLSTDGAQSGSMQPVDYRNGLTGKKSKSKITYLERNDSLRSPMLKE